MKCVVMCECLVANRPRLAVGSAFKNTRRMIEQVVFGGLIFHCGASCFGFISESEKTKQTKNATRTQGGNIRRGPCLCSLAGQTD